MSKIDIDPKNKGKFTATQKRTGKSTEELCHSKNPLTRKRANFAKMAKRGWKPCVDEELCETVVRNVIRRLVNEAFQSDTLRNLQNSTPSDVYGRNRHGGKDFRGKMNMDFEASGVIKRDGLGTSAFLDKITDDMIDDVVSRKTLNEKGYYIKNSNLYDSDNVRRHAIVLSNGSIVVFKSDPETISKLKELSANAGEISKERDTNKHHDGADNYQWSDSDMRRGFRDWVDTGVKFWDGNKAFQPGGENPKGFEKTPSDYPGWRKDSWVRQNMDKALQKGRERKENRKKNK